MARVTAGGAVPRHGVRLVVVLVALLALLHAAHGAGAGARVGGWDSDRCATGTTRYTVPVDAEDAPAEDSGGRPGPADPTGCTPPGLRPRYPSVSASSATSVGGRGLRPADPDAPGARTASNPMVGVGTPARTVVLRC
ncbi:hypothetical protein B4N89_40010 [Embleya scabrispora]|uniref:Uncharacterized protein n=1 Tax=Embleya scabrispora TaxID=159449 RepID=A0A1T3NNI3_9ACTN|nr:hypothetical protein [Embleya scabrispora]OPC78349.1 hypothetical protein B4N89_40010 [Embleya scabrispora]